MPERDRERPSPTLTVTMWLAAGVFTVMLLRRTPLAALLEPWYQTRAAGLMALILLWASLCLGLVQSSGLLKGLTATTANVDVHNFLSVAALLLSAYHGMILLWDHYVGFRLYELIVPFASDYHSFLMGLGILALYISLLGAVTTYLRGHMSARTWRTIHQVTVVGFAFAWIHGLGMGSDFLVGAVGALYAFTGCTALALLVYRIYVGVLASASAPGRR